MRTEHCEICPDEDLNRCNTCDGYGNGILEDKLKGILAVESERIKGEDGYCQIKEI